MPLIEVQLSTKLSAEAQTKVMKSLSQSVATCLGKPESYVMVVLRTEAPVLMGGRFEPAALAEVRSVGSISPAQARQLAGAVSKTIGEVAAVDENRVYCICQGVQGSLWAQGADTFG